MGKKVKQSRYRPEVAQRKLRLPDFVTTAQDGGRLSALSTVTPRKSSIKQSRYRSGVAQRVPGS